MSESIENQARLAEYSALRAEIRHYFDGSHRVTNLALMVTGAAVGVAGTVQSPSGYVFVGAAFLVAVLWFNRIRHSRAVYRVAAYLRELVEPYLPGANWETLGQHHKIQVDRLGSFLAAGVMPLTFVINVLLAAKYLPAGSDGSVIAVGLLAIAGAILLIMSARLHHRAHEEEAKEWRRIAAERRGDTSPPSGLITSRQPRGATMPQRIERYTRFVFDSKAGAAETAHKLTNAIGSPTGVGYMVDPNRAVVWMGPLSEGTLFLSPGAVAAAAALGIHLPAADSEVKASDLPSGRSLLLGDQSDW